jgi:hypothetical protein
MLTLQLTSVFVVQHVARVDEPDEDVKLIGVYSTRERAVTAVEQLRRAPGFCDHADGFHIDEYEIDKDHWVEGFFTANGDPPE